ncbi:MAG: hypothetical protein ACI9TV_002751 [Sulfurimonas sp.]|jgi:hypothetical protein|uniref:cytochrome C oxidase subunit IV family protein n=1 Tax=Sulfurimonas sp. TaxID=2022749 RepID=UPI0039E2D0B9
MSLKVWISLVLLTCATFLVGYFQLINPFIGAFLLFSVLVKGFMISDYFMELREVTFFYRMIPILWLIIVLSLIGYAYYFPIPV